MVRMLAMLTFLAAPAAVLAQDYYVNPPRDLASQAPDTTFVNLVWTAPSAVDYYYGFEMAVESYEIRMSTVGSISLATWNEAFPVDSVIEAKPPGTIQSTVIRGLAQGCTYFFAIRAVAGNQPSDVASFPPATTMTDLKPPGTIDTLAISEVTEHSALLTWTATGDDGVAGTLSRYDLRYSLKPILTLADFEASKPVSGLPAPGMPGSLEKTVVDGLVFNTTYWFAIRAEDEVRNTGSLATSSPNATTLNDDGINHGAGDLPCGGRAAAPTQGPAGLLSLLVLLLSRGLARPVSRA